jgi:hypothetical protein
MGFMSLVFMGVILVLTIVGACEMVAAIVIFVVRRIRKKNHKVGKISLIVAISLLTFGLLSEIPFAFLMKKNVARTYAEKQEYKKLSKKYRVAADDFGEKFKYKGKDLVYVKELNVSWYDEPKCTLEANLIFNNSDKDFSYVDFYKVKNDSPFDVYLVKEYGQIFVEKKHKNELLDYYQNKEQYSARISCFHSNDVSELYAVDINRLNQMILRLEEKTYLTSEIEDVYEFSTESEDFLNEKQYEFLLMKDKSILYCQRQYDYDTTSKIKAKLISDKNAEYIRNLMKQKEQETKK